MSIPPSAQTLLNVLATRGPLTHKQLLDAAPLPPRTLRYALKRLKEANHLVERPNFRDLRQAYYALPGASASATPAALPGPALKNAGTPTFLTAEA